MKTAHLLLALTVSQPAFAQHDMTNMGHRTPNTFAVGGSYRTTATETIAFDLTYLRVYNRVLDSTEIAAEDLCVKASQGR